MIDEFVYDKMTPALEAWLHFRTQAWDSDRLTHITKTNKMRASMQAHELADYHRAHVEWHCSYAAATDEVAHTSPSGKYTLHVSSHNTDPVHFGFTKGVVKNKKGATLATICRNYHMFPFAWVEDHEVTKDDYLLCGYDYQGQTIVQLSNGVRVDYRPEAANDGHGFCFATMHPNVSGTLMAVEGYFWASPYDVVILDFGDPMSMPWPVLHIEECANFNGWSGDISAVFSKSRERLDMDLLDGHHLRTRKTAELTAGDYIEIECYLLGKGIPESSWYKEIKETRTWVLGSTTT